MLSKKNIEKLNMRGLYTCSPKAEYREEMFQRDLLHCCNWVFEVCKRDEDEYYMRDTYWAIKGSNLHIPLTDENFDEFTLAFDLRDVRQVKEEEAKLHRTYYRVATDSGGWDNPNHYVDNEAKLVIKKLIRRIDMKIAGHEEEIVKLKKQKEKLERDKTSVDDNFLFLN